MRYLVLGDVTLAIKTTGGVQIITDNRVENTAKAERAAADSLPNGSPEQTEALVRMKHVELAARNVPGGFWIAAADPSAAHHSLTGEVPLRTIHRLVLMTDGATRAISPFSLYDWPGLFCGVANDGPDGLIKQIRIAEDADSAGIQHPRNKIHDDATIVVADLSATVGRLGE